MPWCLGLLTSPDAANLLSPELSGLQPNWPQYFMKCCMNPLAPRYWHTASLPSENLLLPFFGRGHPCSPISWLFQNHLLREVLLELLGQDLSTQTLTDPLLFCKSYHRSLKLYINHGGSFLCVPLPCSPVNSMPVWSRIYIFNIWHTVGALSQCLMKEAVNECKLVCNLLGRAEAYIWCSFLLQYPDSVVGSGVLVQPDSHRNHFRGLLLMSRKASLRIMQNSICLTNTEIPTRVLPWNPY